MSLFEDINIDAVSKITGEVENKNPKEKSKEKTKEKTLEEMAVEYYQLKDQFHVLEKDYSKVKEENVKLTNHLGNVNNINTKLNKEKSMMQRITSTIIDTFKIRKKYENEICSICREMTGDKSVMNCGHTFHMECLNKALKRNDKCPVCRQSVSLSLFTYETKMKYEYSMKDTNQPTIPEYESDNDTEIISDEDDYEDDLSDDESD